MADFADKLNKLNAAENRLKQIIDDLYNAIANVPNYSWYTVLTQILSRIVHEHEPSFKVLKRIVQNVTLEYPKHCVWYIFSHARSSDKVRKRRVRELLNQVCTQDGNDTLPKSTMAAETCFTN